MPSFDRPTDAAIPPSAWIERFAHLIPANGVVLDMAAGHGRHARCLAERGHEVLAVDVDVSGMADLNGHPLIEVLALDLETPSQPLPGRRFAGIVVTNYLHRPHFPWLPEALQPGGVLLIETFGQGNEKYGRPRNPAFLLAPGELLEAFSGALQIVAYEHGLETGTRPAVRQRLCAIKAPESPAILGARP